MSIVRTHTYMYIYIKPEEHDELNNVVDAMVKSLHSKMEKNAQREKEQKEGNVEEYLEQPPNTDFLGSTIGSGKLCRALLILYIYIYIFYSIFESPNSINLNLY